MRQLEDKRILFVECVKDAFLAGQTSERIRARSSSFTPCASRGSLLEAVAEAAKNATSSDVVLLSQARSSWDQFRNYQHRGEALWQAVKSIGRGVRASIPNIDGKTAKAQQRVEVKRQTCEFCFGFF
jgi:UDP-N-acetylmuramoylalanine-D-glutamate ligase